jgi:hypothetical protein
MQSETLDALMLINLSNLAKSVTVAEKSSFEPEGCETELKSRNSLQKSRSSLKNLQNSHCLAKMAAAFGQFTVSK